MNNYHIYEALGRGKHSVVYKGRKKRSVSYYAIKSVEKSQKSRVLQEVRTMHALDSPNILKFYAWYETTNHLWLILEFCVGGDLMSLISQDLKLPESSMHDFGRDLVTALRELHSHSIIYCDLKPSNVLLDENGRVKLGGFGLSRKLSDINTTPVTGLPPAKRGTPCYMAPELFQEDAPHSSASDLWSVGCVLYECASGHPPFVSTSFNQLVQNILTKDPAPLSGVSKEFSHMIVRLLDKNPATRMTWKELAQHPFWNFRMGDRDLPEEPALEEFIRKNNLRPQASKAGMGSVRDSQSLVGDMLRSVDVSRMSAVARNNLEEADGQEYSAATAGSEKGDVRLENPDAELDFEERQEADAGSEDADMYSSGAEEEDNSGEVALSKSVGGDVKLGKAAPAGGAGAAPRSSKPVAGGETAGQAEGSEQSESVEDLVWHTTDSAVKPIVGNRRIERVPEPRWEARSLPFHALKLSEVVDACHNKQDELEAFLTHIYRSVVGGAPMKDKLNVLAYFETLCMDTTTANVLINSSLTILFVKMLKNAKVPTLRIRLASVIGLLVRHATYIADELAATGVLDTLAEVLRDRNERVRRRCMATLGELLFYVATQQQDTAAGKNDAWQVSSSCIGAVGKLLKAGEDEVAQHYAVKTIENIASQNMSSLGNNWGSWFCTPELVKDLVKIFHTTRNEGLKATTASTLSRLLRCSPALITVMIEKFGTQLIMSGLMDSNAKIQTAGINMLNLCLTNLQSTTKIAQSVSEEQGLMGAVVSLLENNLATLRAKALLSITLLCKLDASFLLTACNAKAVLSIERLLRDKEKYVRAALDKFQEQAALVITSVTEKVALELEKQVAGGKPMPAATSSLSHFPVVLHLLTSQVFKSSDVPPTFIRSLACYVGSMTAMPSGNAADLADFKQTMHQCLEALSQRMEILLEHHQAVLGYLLPSLARAVGAQHESGDTRFLCLKLTCDILLLYLTEPEIYSSGAPNGSQKPGTQIDDFVEDHIMPLLPGLLQDKDPMPLYALKLLGALLEVRLSLVQSVHMQDLLPKFFDFLSLDHSNNNVHNIRLCRLVISSGQVPLAALASLQAIPKVVAVLEYAHENRVEPFLEPVLELCEAILVCDARARDSGAAGSGISQPLVDCYDIFLDLALHPDPLLSVIAAQCQVSLLITHPTEASRALLSTDGAHLAAAVLEGASAAEKASELPRHKTQAAMLQAMRLALDGFGGAKLAASTTHTKLLQAMLSVGEAGDKSVRLQAQESAVRLKQIMQGV